MTALGFGFGSVFLTAAATPRIAAVGFAIMGLAGVCFAATAVLLGLTRRD